MSTVVVSTSAALGRPFVFDDEAGPDVLQGSCGDSRPRLSGRVKLDGNDGRAAKILPSSVIPASRLAIRPAPDMAFSGIPALAALTGGLPRGCLTEICGPASSGRTTVLLAALAAATSRGEFCVVVDASDALDPQSTADAGVDLDRLLWVRCGEDDSPKEHSPRRHPSAPLRAGRDTEKKEGEENSEDHIRSRNTNQPERRLEQVLRATDLLLESGGFGLIVLDLSDLPAQSARRIPLTTWFRFRRAVENKPTILLAIEQQPIAGSCSSLLLQLGEPNARVVKKSKHDVSNAAQGLPSHARLFTGLHINAELIRSRLDRKPSRSVTFETKAAWAG